ncbi:lysozyme inhibitor LprI family protein [Pseudescherichia vulneris]|uniref:lysozyme inhibitor LprI family protein n=1 Tax=Pseudescherichia vulneris TaxID=566 RepID=UPI001EE083A8|nr:lysozyme inhibitor LprI family protein [Pseudescherichia vulneris]
MIKYCLAYIIGTILSTFTINALAESNLSSIVKNSDVNACMDKSGNIDNECLNLVNKRSEKELNDAYEDKLKEISTFDYTRWWMGEKDRREGMKQAFIHSQELWLKYRSEYCKSASTGSEGVDGYGAIALSCHINLGKRRIEEIKMIHPDLSEG